MPILLVSPFEQDHHYLANILESLNRKMYAARSRGEALPLLRKHGFDAVICERDLPDGTWKDLLAAAGDLPSAPALIVVSRLADERLWAEVLNLGGCDVLAKPFEAYEVVRSLHMALRTSQGRGSEWAKHRGTETQRTAIARSAAQPAGAN